MAECDFRVTPSDAGGACQFTVTPFEQSGPCWFTVTPSDGPTPLACEITLAWSPDPVTIPRECFIQGLTDELARDYTFSLGTTLFSDETAVFDEFGNLTFTPSATHQEPPECGSSSRVLTVNADNGAP